MRPNCPYWIFTFHPLASDTLPPWREGLTGGGRCSRREGEHAEGSPAACEGAERWWHGRDIRMRDLRRSGTHEQRCADCGTVLEPHEPVVVTVRDTHAGRTSLAALGELGDAAIALVHERCH